jgi:hypothetical protein
VVEIPFDLGGIDAVPIEPFLDFGFLRVVFLLASADPAVASDLHGDVPLGFPKIVLALKGRVK